MSKKLVVSLLWKIWMIISCLKLIHHNGVGFCLVTLEVCSRDDILWVGGLLAINGMGLVRLFCTLFIYTFYFWYLLFIFTYTPIFHCKYPYIHSLSLTIQPSFMPILMMYLVLTPCGGAMILVQAYGKRVYITTELWVILHIYSTPKVSLLE